MENSRKLRYVARTCALFAWACAVTLANADSILAPSIVEAHADATSTVLHINGTNLAGGDMTTVRLGGAGALAIVRSTATQIDALLPPGVQPGGYLLTLTLQKGAGASANGGETKSDEFWVTIGAVGPQGPAGPAGPMGATGAQGPQGPAGEPGGGSVTTAATIYRVPADAPCGVTAGTLTTDASCSAPKCYRGMYDIPPSLCGPGETSAGPSDSLNPYATAR